MNDYRELERKVNRLVQVRDAHETGTQFGIGGGDKLLEWRNNF